MKLSKILSNISYEIKNNDNLDISDLEVNKIEFDTRNIEKNDMFVCTKGAKIDGHTLALDAEKNGAIAIVASEATNSTLPHIIVNDTRKVLSLMCQNYYNNPQNDLEIIGLTGTNGKTSISYIVKSLLESLGQKVGVIGTIENVIGDKVIETTYSTPVPTQLYKCLDIMRSEGAKYVVMETTSQGLDQERLYGVNFKIGLFTNLTQDHLDYHETMEKYLLAKCKLFEQSETSILNMDDSSFDILKSKAKGEVISYGINNDKANVIAKDIKYLNDKVKFIAVSKGNIGRTFLNIPGTFSVYNALGAICVPIALGFEFDEVIEKLPLARGVKGRVEVVPNNKNKTIIIDYAHTPDSLKKVILSLKEVTKGNIITVFGCGGDRDRTKRPIMGKVAKKYSDYVVVTSDNPRSEDPNLIVEDIISEMKIGSKIKIEVDRRKAIKKAILMAKPEDTVILAGKGHETYQILNTGKIHFDEREIINEILKEI